jgi:hypothetical protein
MIWGHFLREITVDIFMKKFPPFCFYSEAGFMVSNNIPFPEEAVHLDNLSFFFFRPSIKMKSLKPSYNTIKTTITNCDL